MKTLQMIVSIAILGSLLVILGISGEVQADHSWTSSELSLTLNMTGLSVRTGATFKFTSSIMNNGNDTTPWLVAHINIVNLRDDGTYVDPEDWSPERTIWVAPISPGSSAQQSWTIHTILKGDFGIYVVVMTKDTAVQPVASATIAVEVVQFANLNPGGVLPVVVAVPSMVVILMVAQRMRLTGRLR